MSDKTSGTKANDEDKAGDKARAAVLVVHVNVALYAFLYWLTTPVLPYLVDALDVGGNTTFGQLQSLFSLVQLCGSPLVGRLIDVWGPFPALVVSQLSAAAGYLGLALAHSKTTLYLSRLPVVGMHAMHAAQTAVALATSPHDRATSLGRLSLSYGVGFLLGPVAGGVASRSLGYHGVAALAGAVSVLIAAATAVAGRRYAPDPAPAPAADPAPAAAGLSLGEVARVFGLVRVRRVLVLKLVSGFALAVLHSTFGLVAKDQFGVDAAGSGLVFSLVGATSMVTNVVVVGPVTARASTRDTMRGALAVVVLGFSALPFATTVWQLLAVVVPIVAAGTVLSTVATTTLTTVTESADAGTVLGLDMGAGSLARAVAPAAGAYVLAMYGFSAVGVLGIALGVAAFALASAIGLRDGARPAAAKKND